LNKTVKENQSLKDEIDVLKHTSDKVDKLESLIETYKLKLEEMADLKRQMKGLEENNTSYLEKILGMEEEVKRIGPLKSQIDMYKEQMKELHEKIMSDAIRMKKLEFELKTVEEQCRALANEKNRLQLELDTLTHSASSFASLNHGSSSAMNNNRGLGGRQTRSPTQDESLSRNSSSPCEF
jgi:chromosome segregation ATPase